jgi:apolipoprotein N-acyltransferase
LFVMLRAANKPVRLVAAACIPILALIPVIASLHAAKFMQQNRDSINVLAVQANVAAHEKWIKGAQYSWMIYDSLMHSVEPGSFDLAVWPETALPAHLMYQNQFAGSFTALSDELDAWIVTGASDYHRVNDEHLPLNAAFLAGPDRGIVEKCAKRHLVPFGERVPFQFIYPDLRKLNFGQAEFLPGLRPTVFEVEAGGKSARFPVMICYESIFSWIARSAVQRGANLLITISNDAWYGRSPEAEQIAALSRMRCIESRRAMVRAANTGISLLIDPLGREISRTRQFQAAFTGGEIPLCEELTFYVRHGDVCAGFATLVFGIVLLYAALKREAT